MRAGPRFEPDGDWRRGAPRPRPLSPLAGTPTALPRPGSLPKALLRGKGAAARGAEKIQSKVLRKGERSTPVLWTLLS